jgi:type II secretory pathway pseudopilin PulG
MEPQRPRWRLGLSALMLLVIIAALALERWRRERESQRTEALLQAERTQAQIQAHFAEMQAQLAPDEQELVRKVQEAARRRSAGAPGGIGNSQR